jgi:hypothetical protein
LTTNGNWARIGIYKDVLYPRIRITAFSILRFLTSWQEDLEFTLQKSSGTAGTDDAQYNVKGTCIPTNKNQSLIPGTKSFNAPDTKDTRKDTSLPYFAFERASFSLRGLGKIDIPDGNQRCLEQMHVHDLLFK